MLDLPTSRRVVQLYRSCWTPRIHLFEFINISDHSILINSNPLQRSKISVAEDNEVRNEEDSTSKQAHVIAIYSYSSNGKQTADQLLIYHVLRCFRVVWSQFWTFSKCLSALEATTNNQEVKRGLYRLQNVNHLPKDYIHMCLTCQSLVVLLNFNNTSIRFYKYHWP